MAADPTHASETMMTTQGASAFSQSDNGGKKSDQERKGNDTPLKLYSTYDGTTFEVPQKEAFINGMIRELYDEEENEGEIVPLDIRSDLLKIINDFNHKVCQNDTNLVKKVQKFDNEQEENRRDFAADLDNGDACWFYRIEEWCQTFFNNLEKPILGELLLAADYLRNEELRNGVCMKISSLHAGLPAEKTREIFFGENGLGSNVPDDDSSQPA
jgi:hypothetical protein